MLLHAGSQVFQRVVQRILDDSLIDSLDGILQSFDSLGWFLLIVLQDSILESKHEFVVQV